MDELSEGIKAMGEVIKGGPAWLDSMLTILDKWNLLPFGETRRKNALNKAEIQHQLELQEQQHQARLALLESSIKAQCKLKEGTVKLALDAAKRDIDKGLSASEALKIHDTFLERSKTQFYINIIKDQYTRERIALYAIDAALDTPNEPGCIGKISETWVSRFWEYAKGIRDEDILKQWGKLLANEIKYPGTISLKTIDILRTLDSYYANLFFQISPYIIENTFMPSNINKNIDLTKYDLMILDSIGLILINKNIKLEKNKYVFHNKFFSISFTSEKNITYPVIAITPSGMDLLNICNISKENSRIGALLCIETLKDYGINATLSELTSN